MDITYLAKMILEYKDSLWMIGYSHTDLTSDHHVGMIADGSIRIHFYEAMTKSETTGNWFGIGGMYADETCDGIRLPEEMEFAIEKALILS